MRIFVILFLMSALALTACNNDNNGSDGNVNTATKTPDSSKDTKNDIVYDDYVLTMTNGVETIKDTKLNKVYLIRDLDRSGIYVGTEQGSDTSYYGWAANIARGVSAETVLLFRGNKYLEAAPADLPSAGLAEMTDKEGLANSRYKLSVKTANLGNYNGDIRLFAIYPGEFAAELKNNATTQ